MTRRFLASIVPLLALGGCYAASEPYDANSIASALEEENGGMSMEDEAPAFGADDQLDSLELLEPEPAIEDTMESSDDVAAMSSVPEAVRYLVVVVWGQIPADLANRSPHNWSGAFGTNRGGMLVRRTIAFEPETDALLPRNDPRAVPFTSVTMPHHDAMALEIIDREPASPEPLGFGYVSALSPEAPAAAIPVRALLDGPVPLLSDEEGNRMIAVAFAQPVDPCAHGFMMGRWHRVEEGRGVILGGIVDARGELIGHVRGIYGVRENGERVFFGKYIALDGTFRGIFAGHYDAEGHFEGRWRNAAGDVGVLGGEFRENLPDDETGGHFVARWAETSCNLPL